VPEARYVKKQKDLAARLGISQGMLTRIKSQAWWPKKGPQGWDSAECLRIHAEYKRGVHVLVNPYDKPKKAKPPRAPAAKKKASSPPGDTPPEPAPPPEPPPPPEPIDYSKRPEDASDGEWAALQALRNPASAPVELARAAASLMAAELVRARYAGEGLNGQAVGALKRSLEELRKAEEASIATETKAGRLLPREVLEAVCGHLGRLMLLGLEQLNADLATRVLVWVADERFGGLSPETQRAEVQEWGREYQRELREGLADGLGSIVDEESAA